MYAKFSLQRVWPLVAVSYCIPLILYLSRDGESTDSAAIAVPTFLLWPLCMLLTWPTKAIRSENRRVGNRYAFVGYAHLLVIVCLSFFIRTAAHTSNTEGALAATWLAVAFGHLVYFVALVPKLLLPAWKRRNSNQVDIESATRPVLDYVSRVSTNFAVFEKTLSETKQELDASLMDLRSLVGRLQKEAHSAADEATALREEVAAYRSLTKLTKEEQASFLRLLDRRKYLDYFVGFAIGILSSLLASGVWLLGQRLISAT